MSSRSPRIVRSRFRVSRGGVALVAAAGLVLAAGCSDRVAGPDGDLAAESRRSGGDSATATPPVAGTPGSQPGAGSQLAGMRFWVDPNSRPAAQAAAWRGSRPADAAQMDKIAAQAQAQWFGDWTPEPRAEVDGVVRAATAAGRVPVLVAYNIPQRDCGGYSANAQTVDGYRRWIAAFAAGIAGRRAVVILEPDALADLDCLSVGDRATRVGLLREAVRLLAAQPGTLAYLDAGHAEWQPAATMASRIREVGTAGLAGFALNVSNFVGTAASLAYGDRIGGALGGMHYLIDTSRNGLGPTADRQWCNPPGRALGDRPTAATGSPLADAYLWVKAPGESDGSCGGAPAAGEWMASYALGLAQRAGY